MRTDHEVLLRAPRFLLGDAAPAVVRRTDQSFVEGLFRDLRTGGGRSALKDAQRESRRADDAEVLYQPVHRCNTLIVVEAWCDTPGSPPLDRRKIESAGMVLRRVVYEGDNALQRQRWISHEHSVLGWQGLDAAQLDLDPDPERRHAPSVGDPEIDRRLRELRGVSDPYVESVTKLHLAPPDVCAAAGKTLLFGVVPTGDPQVADSAKRNELQRQGVEDPSAQPDTIGSMRSGDFAPEVLRAMVPSWLKIANSPRSLPGGLRNRVIKVVREGGTDAIPNMVLRRSDTADYADWVERGRNDWQREGVDFDRLPLPGGRAGAGQDSDSPGLGEPAEDPAKAANTRERQRSFITMLWQLRFQLRAFDKVRTDAGNEVDSPDAEAMRAALDGLRVTLCNGQTQALYTFLEQASRVLILRESGLTVYMPDSLPPIPRSVDDSVVASVDASLKRQLQRIVPNEGRYDNPDARYEIRAFIRVRREDGCPPALVWTEPTSTYRLARWYEGGPDDAVLPRIELPSIDRGFLKSLKPNVAVQVPPSLFDFIQANAPKDFLDPEKLNKGEGGLGLQWICGFNISIIFIIAFMLLITFVLLLNIVFWWIFFFRICIPFPAKK
ncbi:MAG: hypothetical protein H6741_02365 [Alphaproteobacteria bacterium]|nr:hypothetical protein [Alphaproteobacteria bacterium]MCB9791548.1 hypothetical protein [Alphaproteobacteria bacterium]